jgi:hypothetical protein
MPSGRRELRRILTDLRFIFRLRREDKKALGLKYCASAPLGFKWFRGRKVPDERERQVMAAIVEWRQAGLSWYQIAAQFLCQGIRTTAGREISVSRVRRCYAAALRLQEEQRQSAAGAEVPPI